MYTERYIEIPNCAKIIERVKVQVGRQNNKSVKEKAGS